MPEALTWPSVLPWRVARQGLAQRVEEEQWPALVRRICGLHAQVQSSAELTLWARVDGLRSGVVDGPLWTERTLVKTWAMRGTLHLLDAGDLAPSSPGRRARCRRATRAPPGARPSA